MVERGEAGRRRSVAKLFGLIAETPEGQEVGFLIGVIYPARPMAEDKAITKADDSSLLPRWEWPRRVFGSIMLAVLVIAPIVFAWLERASALWIVVGSAVAFVLLNLQEFSKVKASSQ